MPQHSPPPVPPTGHRSQQPDATAPDGSEIRLLIDQRHQATKASLCEVTLAAGQVSRPVWHQTVEEIWYVLEGRGSIWRSPPASASQTGHQSQDTPQETAEEIVVVGPGDALTIPIGWSFQFSAGTETALRFLCYTNPPWPGSQEAQPAGIGGLGEATV